MRKATVLDRQSLWDIALREHGSVEALFEVLADNPSVEGPAAPITAGQLLDVRTPARDTVVVEHYRRNALFPVTEDVIPVDYCSGYPCIPRNLFVHSVVTAPEQASLQVSDTPVGRRFFVADLAAAETPETNSLFARHTGYVMVWLGLGSTAGVEGTPWSLMAIAPGTVVSAETGGLWKSWLAQSGSAEYPSGRFGLPWLANPTLEGSFERLSRSLDTPITPTQLSPCRWMQVQRQSLMEGGDFVDYGPRRKENDTTLTPLTGGLYLYRIKWTTGVATECVQGYSSTILVV